MFVSHDLPAAQKTYPSTTKRIWSTCTQNNRGKRNFPKCLLPTIQITISPLQCLASTKFTELNQVDIQSLPRREHGGFNYNARQRNAVQENNLCGHTHKSWVYVKKWRFLTFKRVAQCSNHASYSDYRQDKVASNVQPALRVNISAVDVKCRFIERTTSSHFNKVIMC